MPPLINSTGLTITNPLVKYRALIATKQISPDPAQHRLALQLQKLYYRLKDYEPEIEYSQRLDQIARTLGETPQHGAPKEPTRERARFPSLWRWRSRDDILALTRTATTQEAALNIQSPKGLLLYGEVGRGKSMLLDLLAQSLPTRKKRRWHFNTFMLDTFRRLESQREARLTLSPSFVQEHSILSLARDMISTSPILFLDEFQLPDRAASKLMSSLMTCFFHLGGVLIATSNRMPEELSKASGVEFTPPPATTAMGGLTSRLGLVKRSPSGGASESMFSGATDFARFLDVLKARCEVWEMEGEKDWRREDLMLDAAASGAADGTTSESDDFQLDLQHDLQLKGVVSEAISETTDSAASKSTRKAPAYYHVHSSASPPAHESTDSWNAAVNGLFHPAMATPDWTSARLQVYGRPLFVPMQCSGIMQWTFADLCGTNLGPADYITLASTYHTLILTSVPVLTLLQKNEARRFITLLDALYEARCKLLIRAQAGPDELFFPEMQTATGPGTARVDSNEDSVYQEMISDIYQDASSPFRPNIASYEDVPQRRSVLADEDADFGPAYGNGRGRGVFDHSTPPDLSSLDRTRTGPDFTRTSLYTGQDEQFAYKRARSRLWELCGNRWWDSHARDPSWWRPLTKDARPWEVSSPATSLRTHAQLSESPELGTIRDAGDEQPFKHGATSPFRTRTDAPPKFSFVHVWGMMTWGKRAGIWGKGPEAAREKERPANDDK